MLGGRYLLGDTQISRINSFFAILTQAMPFGKTNAMKNTIPIDGSGRLVLPQPVRRQFHLVAGDLLDLEIVPDGVFLRAHSRQADLVEENGLLVHEGEAAGDLTQTVEQVRGERDANVLGLRR